MPTISPVFLNFLTTTHSKKNTLYGNPVLTYKSIQKQYYPGFTPFAFLDLLSTLLQLMLTDPNCRLSCPPAKGGFGPWEALAGDADGRRRVGVGIFSYWLLPASLLWDVCLPLLKITAPVRPPSPSSILEACFLFTSSGLRMRKAPCYYQAQMLRHLWLLLPLPIVSFIKQSSSYSIWVSSVSWQYLADRNPYPDHMWRNLMFFIPFFKKIRTNNGLSLNWFHNQWVVSHSLGNIYFHQK